MHMHEAAREWRTGNCVLRSVYGSCASCDWRVIIGMKTRRPLCLPSVMMIAVSSRGVMRSMIRRVPLHMPSSGRMLRMRMTTAPTLSNRRCCCRPAGSCWLHSSVFQTPEASSTALSMLRLSCRAPGIRSSIRLLISLTSSRFGASTVRPVTYLHARTLHSHAHEHDMSCTCTCCHMCMDMHTCYMHVNAVLLCCSVAPCPCILLDGRVA